MNAGNDKYSYPEKWVSVLFASIFVALLTGWLVVQLLGDRFTIWVIENFEIYHLENVFLVFFAISEIWVLFFSVWLVLLGYKSILGKTIPPKNYLLLFKVKNGIGKQAIHSGLILVIFGIFSFMFFCVMVYVSYVSHGGSI